MFAGPKSPHVAGREKKKQKTTKNKKNDATKSRTNYVVLEIKIAGWLGSGMSLA